MTTHTSLDDVGVEFDAAVFEEANDSLMRHPQAFSEQKLQLVAEALAPMAQVRALVRERMLEKLLPGEVLEIRIVDPAIAHLFVGQGEDVFEKQQPDHEAALDAGPTLLAVKRRDLAIEPVPVDALGKLHQLVLHVDDLIEPRPEQIARPRRCPLPRPHRTSSASPQAMESRRAIQRNRGRPFCNAVSNPKCNRAA